MKTTNPKLFCFVLMPFSESFTDVYKLGIKSTVENAGVFCERLDEQIFHESMLSRIYNQIAKADFIVADMTGHNPNVFYEVGYAHALGKRTILIAETAEEIPFDLKHFLHVVYGNSILSLREQLDRHVRSIVLNQNKPSDAFAFPLEVSVERSVLSEEQNVLEVMDPLSFDFFQLEVNVRNVSGISAKRGDIRLSFIYDDDWDIQTEVEHTVRLPSGGSWVLHKKQISLLPEQYESYSIAFNFSPDAFEHDDGTIEHTFPPDNIKVTLRFLTHVGYRDFPLLLTRSESYDSELAEG